MLPVLDEAACASPEDIKFLALCSSTNSADSGRWLRPQSVTSPGTRATRNGKRQPHSNMRSGPSTKTVRATRPCEITKATYTHNRNKAVPTPSTPGGADSAIYVTKGPISPPVHTPCRARNTMRSTRPTSAEASPQQRSDGRSPCATVANNMPRIDQSVARFRPTRSASSPKTMPPTGRRRNVTANPLHVPKVEARKKLAESSLVREP
mmetsp:Transcript_44231/g.111172  ORF Transcript_44231/g.111172 Transcript_44231/m.111172 type:complete len:208 (-) Transcript_44231:156-779(-)